MSVRCLNEPLLLIGSDAASDRNNNLNISMNLKLFLSGALISSRLLPSSDGCAPVQRDNNGSQRLNGCAPVKRDYKTPGETVKNGTNEFCDVI